MHRYQRVRLLVVLMSLLLVAMEPTSAARKVFDTWASFGVSGYCSPNTVGCGSYAMPFSLQIGGNSYSSFYVNSNGTVSLSSIEPFLTAQYSPEAFPYTGAPPVTDLAAYQVPIFSPNFVDGPGYFDDGGNGYDGEFVGQVSAGSNSFTVDWYSCAGFPLICGPFSANLVASQVYDPINPAFTYLQDLILDYWGCSVGGLCTRDQQSFDLGQQLLLNQILTSQPVYTMTLTSLSDGFRVDYSYNTAATGQQGVFGFSLPSGTYQQSAPLVNRSYLFDSFGNPVAVPEPSTWMTMLLGFAMIGLAMRRKRYLQAV